MSRFLLYTILLGSVFFLSVDTLPPVMGTEQKDTAKDTAKDTVKIGLLIPDSSRKAIIRSAWLAIEKANLQDGLGGQPFELVVRTAEGPWGAGSKASVSLVFEDDVSVIVGALDGRNSHLAEQVAAKSHVVYVETMATDPTLSQAFVPWFYRMVPNDDQQSAGIIDLIEKGGGGKTAILTMDQYDATSAVNSFIKILASLSGSSPLLFKTEPGEREDILLADRIISSGVENLVIPFYTEGAINVLQQLGIRNAKIKIYGSLAFARGLFLKTIDFSTLEGLDLVMVHAFEGSVIKSRDEQVTIPSLYLLDAMNLVISAIRQGGPERESINETLAGMEHSGGLTGPVSFDRMGNRKGPLQFIRITDGKIIIVP